MSELRYTERGGNIYYIKDTEQLIKMDVVWVVEELNGLEKLRTEANERIAKLEAFAGAVKRALIEEAKPNPVLKGFAEFHSAISAAYQALEQQNDE